MKLTKGLLPLILSVLILAAFQGQIVRAELAERVEMDQVCTNWLQQAVYERGSWASETDPSVVGVSELKSGDTLLALCYEIAPAGFVVVPVLKEMTPVKMYSEVSGFDVNDDGGIVQLIRETLSSRMSLYAEQFGSLDALQPATGDAIFGRSQKETWDKYTVPAEEFNSDLRATRSTALAEVGPLLVSSWNQGTPYNNDCPIGDGGRCVVGCVATAAAQILYYWQWPASGFGTHSYTWEGDHSCGGSTPSQVLTADFSDPYDWANMLDSTDLGYTGPQAAALAELNYETGVAFNMDYGVCGSGASVSRAVTVFQSFFKYSPDILRVNRTDYTLQGWYDLVAVEIDAGRPIQYRINLHSIVCDGYRDQGGQLQYHMNYGWAGNSTAWYVLDSLYCGWIAGDICPADEEFMITHIYPQTEPVISMIGCTSTEADGDGDGHADPGEQVDLMVQIVNSGWDATNTVGFLSSDDPDITINTASSSFDASIPWGDSSYCQTAFNLTVDPTCSDPHIALLELSVTADGGFSVLDTILLFVGDTPGFEDQMESGAGFWMHSNVTSGYFDEWHMATNRFHSPGTSWKAGGPGTDNYADMSDGGLVTPPFLLPSNPVLTFWHWIDAELDANPELAWDGAIVMISTGGGLWTQISPEGGYPFSIVENPASPFEPGTPCYSGQFGWQQAEFDLSAYSGVVQLMFRFGSDGYVTEEGWYIDDVLVESGGCCVGITGNVDADTENIIDIGDLTLLINYLFIPPFPVPECMDEANVDGAGPVDIGDLTALINYLFIPPFDPPAPCP